MEIGVADGENARKMVMNASLIFPMEEVKYSRARSDPHQNYDWVI